ncbi:hypothetical protein [Actinomycetospora atypica]|uniref:Prevent-host-death family protein n=1 Tax=Actinomycetospora atypica TaxID=1290095 RepID=A0ABV9YNK1_9PSEU
MLLDQVVTRPEQEPASLLVTQRENGEPITSLPFVLWLQRRSLDELAQQARTAQAARVPFGRALREVHRELTG